MHYQVNTPITLGTIVDAKKTALGTDAVVIGKVPAGFIVKDVVIEEVEKASESTTMAVTVGTTSVATNKAIGGSTLAKHFANTNTPCFDGADVKVTTAAAVTGGAIRVHLVGYIALGPVPVSDNDNKASVDPMYA